MIIIVCTTIATAVVPVRVGCVLVLVTCCFVPIVAPSSRIMTSSSSLDDARILLMLPLVRSDDIRYICRLIDVGRLVSALVLVACCFVDAMDHCFVIVVEAVVVNKE